MQPFVTFVQAARVIFEHDCFVEVLTASNDLCKSLNNAWCEVRPLCVVADFQLHSPKCQSDTRASGTDTPSELKFHTSISSFWEVSGHTMPPVWVGGNMCMCARKWCMMVVILVFSARADSHAVSHPAPRRPYFGLGQNCTVRTPKNSSSENLQCWMLKKSTHHMDLCK